MKLPTFYLLDTISKNIYEPYTWQFTPSVIPLFLKANKQVDQNIPFILPAINIFLNKEYVNVVQISKQKYNSDDFVNMINSFSDVLVQHLTNAYIYMSCSVLSWLRLTLQIQVLSLAFVTPQINSPTLRNRRYWSNLEISIIYCRHLNQHWYSRLHRPVISLIYMML